jgi:hypothetical protein
MSNGEDEQPKKDQTAKEIAEIMVENMKANMANPDFLDEQARIREKVRAKVLKERKERRERKD